MSIYRTRYLDRKNREVRLLYVASMQNWNNTKKAMINAFQSEDMQFLNMRHASEKECAEINSMFY